MKINELLLSSDQTVCIVGHVHPDGDCLGSQTAVYRYLEENCPGLQLTLYTKDVLPNLEFLMEGIDWKEDDGEDVIYDLAISVDASRLDRIPAGLTAFNKAKRRVCIDHHETNYGFGNFNIIEGNASSTAEVLMGLMEDEKISAKTAISLYTGIVHDTGVFRYPCTSPETLRKAAKLVEKGIPFSKIIENSFVNMRHKEMCIMGRVMSEAVLIPEESFKYSFASREMQEEFDVLPVDLGAIVSRLNETDEAEVILFLYQNLDGTWKGSLRSRCDVNVAKIAETFGGGGHEKSAGFSLENDPEKAVEKVRELIKAQK